MYIFHLFPPVWLGDFLVYLYVYRAIQFYFVAQILWKNISTTFDFFVMLCDSLTPLRYFLGFHVASEMCNFMIYFNHKSYKFYFGVVLSLFLITLINRFLYSF